MGLKVNILLAVCKVNHLLENKLTTPLINCVVTPEKASGLYRERYSPEGKIVTWL